ncbi:hypothetical protein BHE74_00045609 [Ensete ventricosum]|uniref:Uncharacterized protein n=1 Tax=Ensete ventricosum TaxID=4639 RepID=A0A445MLP5_ENSVE|nr:hypothetical protein BHE74_00045609 [Ensete ventricosum]RZR75128.1 hypothetical protein BHM03_00049933 [Ensete ventricosum]
MECVRSSSRVSEVCQDSTREFVGRRPRLAGRLSGVAETLVGSWKGLEVDVYGPRIKLRHQAKDWTMRLELTGHLLELHRRGCWIAGVRPLCLLVMYDCNP